MQVNKSKMPTQADFYFWQARSKPKWAKDFRVAGVANIHSCINSKAMRDRTTDARNNSCLNNTMTILRNAKTLDRVCRLVELSKDIQSMYWKKRQVLCRRWLKKLHTAQS